MSGVVGLTGDQLVGLGLAGVVMVGFLVALAYISKGKRRARGRPDIPAAMQPGPSDPDLEKPSLEKLQGWGVAFVLFFVAWIPLVWLREPSENLNQERALYTESVHRGELSVQAFSEENQAGVGCDRCHGEEPRLGGGRNYFDGGVVTVPRLTDVCGGENTGHPRVTNIEDLRNIVEQGLPGTDMPSWSVRFGGSLLDQQIQDIVNYIVVLNSDQENNPEAVPFEQNVCINPEAPGYVEPVVEGE